jgi:single-strand DNA-binding protein
MTGAEVTISGNITSDPELRFTQNGVPVAGFNVAHTPRRLNRATGEWEDYGETLFLRVNVWREQGENIAASLHKGDAVLVIGRLVSRSYETKEGEKRTSVECDADIVSVDLRRARIDRAMRVRRGLEAPEQSWAPAPAPEAVAV